MVQTPAGTTRNGWIQHMRSCAKTYREEQEAKAKAEAAPKRRLNKKTSPEEAQKTPPDAPKPEAAKPKRRLVRKTPPEEALVAAPPVVAEQLRSVLKKMSEAAAALAAAQAVTQEVIPAPIRRRLTQKTAPTEAAETAPTEPKRRLTKKTPSIHSRWQSPP